MRLSCWPGLARTFGEVHQPIAAHPHLVVRTRQVGNDVAPLVVGDDDPANLVGSSVVSAITRRLPGPAGGTAANVVVVDGDRRLLGTRRRRNRPAIRPPARRNRSRPRWVQDVLAVHVCSPWDSRACRPLFARNPTPNAAVVRASGGCDDVARPGVSMVGPAAGQLENAPAFFGVPPAATDRPATSPGCWSGSPTFRP